MKTKEEELNSLTKRYIEGETNLVIRGLKKLIQKHQDFYPAYYNLGIIFKKKHNYKKAISYLEKATKDKTESSVLAKNELALCFKHLGNYKKAIEIFKNAENKFPSNWQIKYNLAVIYQELGELKKAEKYYKIAHYLTHDSQILLALAQVLFLQNKLKRSRKICKLLIKERPTNPDIYMLLGHIAYQTGNYQKAIDLYEKTLSLDPDYELGYSCLFMAKRRICDFNNLEKINEYLNKTCNQDPWGSLLRIDNLSVNKKTACLWAKKIEKNKNIWFKHKEKKFTNQKIRLGYISNNFYEHPVGYMMANILQNHNKKKFEVFLYSYQTQKYSPLKKKLEKLSNHFKDLDNLSDLDASYQIYKDSIDILIDLVGYTEKNRLSILATKPATIQISWAEYLGTTGSNFFDYIIADKILIPEKLEKYYTERIIHLPQCSYLRQSNPNPIITNYTRGDFNIPKNIFVFGCFHQFIKIDPFTFQNWMEILKEAPESILWLWKQNDEGQRNLQKEAEKFGINPKRLIFAPTLDADHFFSRLNLADLSLDTFVYGGGITSFQTLAAGVPLITIIGNHMPSRITADLLMKLKLKKLIAKSPEEYKRKAIFFYKNQKEIKNISNYISSAKVRKRLWLTKQIIRALEKTLEKLLPLQGSL